MSALTEVLSFYLKGIYQNTEYLYRAENRTHINDQLLKWIKEFQINNVPLEKAQLLSSLIGELGNNAFDHNLGKWRDQVGCLIGIDFLDDRLRVSISDRGQGIANSLRRIRPKILNNFDFLKMAFEEIVSGRSPEKRGNGLKFLKKMILNQGGLTLVCLSSNSQYDFGIDNKLKNDLSSIKPQPIGTLIVFDWKKE